MSDILDCCGCCILCCACFSICGRVCVYMPWGKRKAPENLEDEIYAAEVERQMEMEAKNEQQQAFTRSQPHAQTLPNPKADSEVKGYVVNNHNGQENNGQET